MCQALFWHKSSWDSTEQKMPEQEEFSQNMEHVLKQRANFPAQAVEQDPAVEKRRMEPNKARGHSPKPQERISPRL